MTSTTANKFNCGRQSVKMFWLRQASVCQEISDNLTQSELSNLRHFYTW